MTVTATPSPARTSFNRTRALLAAAAVIALGGAAVVAPLTASNAALADEAFYERIHQEFVPADIEPLAIPLDSVQAEELPAPEPEPAAPAASAGSPAPLYYTGGGSPAEWMAAAGIAESDWGYVDYIASRESGWNPNATNSSSGACGLIQAHPCSKVPGSGYDPVDNLRWANGYAIGRYGSWAGAYAFWTANHWW